MPELESNESNSHTSSRSEPKPRTSLKTDPTENLISFCLINYGYFTGLWLAFYRFNLIINSGRRSALLYFQSSG